MEFRDLKRQYQMHRAEIDSAVQHVIDRGDFIHGAQVTMLEEKLAEYVGVKHCVSCANGTDALQLALMAWGIGSGDAVFVPDFTFFASGEVVPLVGAFPVFVDVDPDTYNIGADSLVKAVQYVKEQTDYKPRAVVAVDLFGQPADFKRIREIADEYHLLVLEDAAQGFGGKIGNHKACSFGDIAATSFFPAKPLGCYGDGGAVFTESDEWAEVLRSYCVHGKGHDKYDNVRIGMNSRLDTIQAAVLLEKLKFFDEETARCNQIAEEYDKLLQKYVKIPVISDDVLSSRAQYTIRLQNNTQREKVIECLKNRGIPNAVYYKKPLHLQQAFSKYMIDRLCYTVSEEICQTCVSLPMHPYLENENVELICDAVIMAVND